MIYIEVTFSISPNSEITQDVLNSLLADIGYESFIEWDGGIKAYVQQSAFDESSLNDLIRYFPLENVCIEYSKELIEDKNWNEEWEKNFFEPLIIGDNCIVHSTFHKDIPHKEYDIIINPQMAFGTGHHETTSLIIQELLDADLKDKSVLDMGCGTSILAILAAMKGADPITAIDIDTWCVENSKDNIRLNNINNITVELGDASCLKDKGIFDVIIANINRNILLNDMHFYVSCMKKGSTIYMSGFYTEDIPLIQKEAQRLKLNFISSGEKNNWAVVKFTLDE